MVNNSNNDRFIVPLIQLAPKILVAYNELQLVIGLYEAISKFMSGDRTGVYDAIIKTIRTKLSQEQCDRIISIMQTTVSAIEFADKIKDILSQIIDVYHGSSKDSISVDYNSYDDDLKQILLIAERAVLVSNN